MKNFTTTEKKAIALAKSILKAEHNISRLSYSTVTNTSCQCYCGETHAISVTAKIKGEWYYEAVGICKKCAKRR